RRPEGRSLAMSSGRISLQIRARSTSAMAGVAFRERRASPPKREKKSRSRLERDAAQALLFTAPYSNSFPLSTAEGISFAKSSRRENAANAPHVFRECLRESF